MRTLMESCLQVPEMMPSGCAVSVTAGLCGEEGRGAGGGLVVAWEGGADSHFTPFW